MRLLILAFLCSAFVSTAQDVPVLFEPGLISDGGVFGFTLSPDGKEAFWVRSKGKRDTLLIMQSRRVRGTWQQPVHASFSGNPQWKDIDPVFSPDGKIVLFQSNRPADGKPHDPKDFDIWAVKMAGGTWGKPYHLGSTVNSSVSESYASMSSNGNIYFMKENPDGAGRSDIYVSRFENNAYQVPENIGLPVNTNERESNPFIFPDENTLVYFSSNPEGAGDVDLYIAHRVRGKWSEPKNLGPPVNTALAEFCPFVHVKQKRLYFARQEKGTDRMIENIYWYPFRLNALR